MQVNVGEQALKLVNMTGKGLLLNNMPIIARGVLVELLKKGNISFRDVVRAVSANERVWDRVPPANHPMIKNVYAKVGDIRWFTSDWVIDAIRNDFPSIASLFLSDQASRAWLDAQVSDILAELVK